MSEMNRSDELREQIDACRAGSDDLHLPELAGLATALEQDRAVAAQFDRSQQFDRQVISALHDVPVPTGLLDRLLSKTAAAQPVVANHATSELGPTVARAAGEASPQTTDESPTVAKEIAAPTHRLWLWRAGSLAAAAAAIVIVAFIWLQRMPRTITQEQLATDVPAWIAQANSLAQWKPTTRAVSSYPLDRDVRTAPVKWQNYRTPAGDAGVVYEMTPIRKEQVFLFVINAQNKYVVDTAPRRAIPGTTGGIQIAAWQRPGEPLYVLVVGQGGLPLREYLRVSEPI